MKFRQFSVRAFLIFSALASILLVILIYLSDASHRHRVFVAPYHVIGKSFSALTTVLFLASPLLLITIVSLLYFRSPRPFVVFVFLWFTGLTVLMTIVPGSPVASDHAVEEIISFVLSALSIGAITEVAVRKLHSHYLTAALTLPVALAYWFLACLVRAVAG